MPSYYVHIIFICFLIYFPPRFGFCHLQLRCFQLFSLVAFVEVAPLQRSDLGNWRIRHSWANSWGIDWHRLRSMQIRSFNEFSAERTKSLITSSSPRQVFRSLPLSLWSPTSAINTHHRTSRAGAKKCAPNEQASEIHPAKSNPWIASQAENIRL